MDYVNEWKEKELERSLEWYGKLLEEYNQMLYETRMAAPYWNDRKYFEKYKGMTREECIKEHDRLYGIQKSFIRNHTTALATLDRFKERDAEKGGYEVYATVKDPDYNFTLEYKCYYGQYKINEEKAREVLKKLIDKHFETLQAKVEKKIGKIVKIMGLGGDDYRFEGELGSCNVEVILAGGYNIQRLHTRWIIKNVQLKEGI